MIERWAPIEGHAGYEVSDHGRVRTWHKCGVAKTLRDTPKLLKHNYCYEGYPRLAIVRIVDGKRTKKSFRVHRLVAAAFVSGDRTLWVSHLDGNRKNNHYSNLKWVTQRENMSHTVAHGTRQVGERHISSKLCDRGVRAVIRLRKRGLRPAELAEIFEISQSTVIRYATLNGRGKGA